MREGYDVGQICLNGHVINEFSIGMPEHNQQFCGGCGSPTITDCPFCNTQIRGGYYAGGGVFLEDYAAPKERCISCLTFHPVLHRSA
ncbi:MAG: DUF2321 domain-containing protein [Anaerolineales bacterium]